MKKLLLCVAFIALYAFISRAQFAQQFLLNNNDFKNLKNNASKNEFWFTYASPRLSLTPSTDAPFIAVSFKLNGINKSQILSVLLISRNDTSTFIENLIIKPAHDADEDENYVSELIFLKNTSAQISLEIISTEPINFHENNLILRAYYPSNEKIISVDEASKFRGVADCSLPKAVSRNVWGAAYGLTDGAQYKNDALYADVTHLIVHHGSSPNVTSNWAAVVASYFDYHVNTNGWSDIGYNYLVAPDGTLFIGRGGGDNVVGAHYCGKNSHTMGVCMIGTYNDVLPTDTALQTLVKILVWKSKKENISPNGASLFAGEILNHIDGHRSGCATECPGNMVWTYLPKLRERVVNAVNACTSTPTNDVVTQHLKILPNILHNDLLNCSGDFKINTNWQISNLNGRVYQSGKILTDTQNFNIPIENLNLGVYFLTIQNQYAVTTEKFIKVE